MKVLWFTGVKPPAVTGQKPTRGFWQEGLRSTLEKHHPELELGIASIGNEDYVSFTKGNTTYFNVLRKTVEHSRIGSIIHGWKPYQYDFAEAERYKEVVNEFKPNLIVSYGIENPFIMGLKNLDIPILVTIQGSVEQITRHYFDGLNRSEFMRLVFSKNFVLGRSAIQRYLYLRSYIPYEKEFFKHCQNFSGRTHWDKNLVLTNRPDANYHHCDNIINPIFYSQQWQGSNTDEVHLYSTCSNAIFKGSLTLVKGIKILKDRGHKNIKLRLAGMHPESEIGKMTSSFIQHNDLNDTVTLLGRVQQSQIVDEVKNCDIYISPSHMENSPNSLAEAMSMGAPCVASNAGGTTSLIAHEEEGLVYQHNDIEALANSIERFILNPDYARELAAQGRIASIKRNDPAKVADTMFGIYDKLINSSPD